MVTVAYQANDQAVGAGQSVATLRSLFASPFNIPAGAAARLNGEAVEDEDGTITYEGDKLLFVATTGEKGARY